ncbi:hypothetical protein HDU76_008214 [Blyttiomyces sp. JEL0837]|nr:hypothetical protein HDU76_008214 [Blyttiomyces sp. JEL0837]
MRRSNLGTVIPFMQPSRPSIRAQLRQFQNQPSTPPRPPNLQPPLPLLCRIQFDTSLRYRSSKHYPFNQSDFYHQFQGKPKHLGGILLLSYIEAYHQKVDSIGDYITTGVMAKKEFCSDPAVVAVKEVLYRMERLQLQDGAGQNTRLKDPHLINQPYLHLGISPRTVYLISDGAKIDGFCVLNFALWALDMHEDSYLDDMIDDLEEETLEAAGQSG